VARQRLGVVLLVPQPLATQIDGVRRALGDGALGRIPPHITLVPPVNVADRDLPTAFAVVRRAAAATIPLELRVGPAATFQPVNPVAYLAVGGAAEQLAALSSLRAACLAGPLDRPQDHEFVPHVTIADQLAPLRLDSVGAVLGDFKVDVTIDRVHVLAEQPGRVWVPIADMALGVADAVVGRGSLPLDVSVSGRPDLEAASLLAIDGDVPGLPFAVTARRDGNVVAAAWGWSAGGHLEVADLVVAVAHRGQGVGRHLVAQVEALARSRSCARVGATAPREGAAAALLRSCGWVLGPAASAGEPGDRGRWERGLPTADE
jgi:2'-5' RNA ligase/GNAT superfamily N-acetyltransferase